MRRFGVRRRGIGRIIAPSFLAGRVKTATGRGCRRGRDQGNFVLGAGGAWGHSPVLPLDLLRRWDGTRGAAGRVGSASRTKPRNGRAYVSYVGDAASFSQDLLHRWEGTEYGARVGRMGLRRGQDHWMLLRLSFREWERGGRREAERVGHRG